MPFPYAILSMLMIWLVPIEKAYAWGHLDFIASDWGASTLTYVIVKQKKISYCAKSELTDRFPVKNIYDQVRQALKVWLQATGKYRDTALIPVNCATETADLVTEVG